MDSLISYVSIFWRATFRPRNKIDVFFSTEKPKMFARTPPPGSTTLRGKKKSQNKNFDNHITTINSEIDHRDDGDVHIAQQISNI
jgi:hypothetical protein